MTDVQTTPDVETQDAERAEPTRTGVASTRRLVLLGAGAAGATAVLAACGTGSTGGGDTGDTGGATGGGTALAATADVPQGGGIISGDLVITQPVSGTYKAFSKVCTHAGCEVSKVDGGVIKCPCHGSTFSITDGSPTAGPAKTPLASTDVKVAGGNIVAA